MTWHEIHKRFMKLSEKTGRTKSSSYSMGIYFRPSSGTIAVTLGGYDIGDWGRHECVGGFKTEEEAMAATIKKIEQAELMVANSAEE